MKAEVLERPEFAFPLEVNRSWAISFPNFIRNPSLCIC